MVARAGLEPTTSALPILTIYSAPRRDDFHRPIFIAALYPLSYLALDPHWLVYHLGAVVAFMLLHTNTFEKFSALGG